MNFKVGDRVRCLEVVDDNPHVMDMVGTVKIIKGGDIGVDFQQDVEGHELTDWDDGIKYAAAGEGWWCYPESLRKVNTQMVNK